MTNDEYLNNHFPKDFIKIGDEVFIIPVGFELSIDIKEIGNKLTTADGTTREDIINEKKSASFKYKNMYEKEFQELHHIVRQIKTASFETEKKLFTKKLPMINTGNIYNDFDFIEIETVDLKKYSYDFRGGKIFVYSGVTLKIN
ncbi:MAG: hypothetical protein P1P64_03515 [Treponemataceae bacterium]